MLNGEQLKRVRELRGISQSMLANYLGITNRYIIYCEQGVYEPAEDLYERWINALYCNEIYNASKRKVNSSADLKKIKTSGTTEER
jgi:transcriptional regulator with XRE-family HTH domain